MSKKNFRKRDIFIYLISLAQVCLFIFKPVDPGLAMLFAPAVFVCLFVVYSAILILRAIRRLGYWIADHTYREVR